MSASKKKRLGSQRRPLNAPLNAQEPPEGSDKASDLPAAQGRQRADAKADLTLSPDSAQSETSRRKKKTSQRGKERLQPMDVSSDSSNKPTEEQEGPTSQQVVSNNERFDEFLEINLKTTISKSEAAVSDLLWNDASNVRDLQDTLPDTWSDLRSKVSESEKYLTEMACTQEGVLSEADQAHQMPDIFEAPIPAGVTGESTRSASSTEHEGVGVTDSQDHNKPSAAEKAGPAEEPVCQDTDKSSLPVAKSRKMGSSRRKKVVNLEESQDQDKMALETNDLVCVDDTQEDGQVLNIPPILTEDKVDMDEFFGVVSSNLSDGKENEEPHLKVALDQMKEQTESKVSDEEKYLPNEDLLGLSLVETPASEDAKTPVIPPNYFVTDAVVDDVEAAMISETGVDFAPQFYETTEANKESSTDTKSATTLEGDLHPKNDEASSNEFAEDDNVRGEINVKEETSASDLEKGKSPFPEDDMFGDLMLSFQPGMPPSTEAPLRLDKTDYDLLTDVALGPVDERASSSQAEAPEEGSSEDEKVHVTESPDQLIRLDDEPSIAPQVSTGGEGQLDDGQPAPRSVDDELLFPADARVVAEGGSAQPGRDESPQELSEIAMATEGTSDPTAAMAQEPVSQSTHFYPAAQDSDQSVTRDVSESGFEVFSATTVEPMVVAREEQEPFSEGVLHLDQIKDEIVNINTAPVSFWMDEHVTDVEMQSKDAPLSSGSEVLKVQESSSLGLTEQDELRIVNIVDHSNILGHQSEQLISLTDGSSSDSELNEEDEVKLDSGQSVGRQQGAVSSEPERGLDPFVTETNAPLIAHFTDTSTTSGAQEIKTHDSADNEGFQHGSTEETVGVEMNERAEAQQSTERTVHDETSGGSGTDVQQLDMEMKAPDLQQSPVKRKFGSSRRSKARKDVDSEDRQSSTDEQTDESVKPSEEEDGINEQKDEAHELMSLQMPRSDDTNATVSVGDGSEEINTMPDGENIVPESDINIEEVTVSSREEQTESANVADVILEETAVDSSLKRTVAVSKVKTDQSDSRSGGYGLKEPINVHQLTYISDSETPEDMDRSSQPAELQEPLEPKPGDSAKPKGTEVFPFSGKDQTPDVQENEFKTLSIQRPFPPEDAFTIKGLKSDLETEGSPHDINVNNMGSQNVAGYKETTTEETNAIQSVAKSAETFIEDQEGSQGVGGPETKSSESKRRKMGSTRKNLSSKRESPQEEISTPLNLETNVLVCISNDSSESKGRDKEENSELTATLSVKAALDEKDLTPSLSEETANALSGDMFANLEANVSERQEVHPEGEGRALQTEGDLADNVAKVGTTLITIPTDSSEMQPPSPGKRRKMGSMRKDFLSKRESPHEETEVAPGTRHDPDGSNAGSDPLATAAIVHQPPSKEETPLSRLVPEEKPRSGSKETEPSSQYDAMAVDAAVARRRKMGSNRRSSPESVLQSGAQDMVESGLHPLAERKAETPRPGQTTKAGEGTAPRATADSRPASERIAPQPFQPANVRRVLERNINISTGHDPRASRYEVVMIGDSSVGKTTFIQRAQSGRFSTDIPSSIGMDSYKLTVAVNGKNVVLHLWDTAGQERFRSMTKQIFHRAQAFLLMYDVTCTQTFAAVSYWANCVKESAAENAVVLLLGNKCDHMERKVNREDGEILAEENGFAFMECSAATGENVAEALETVARLLSVRAEITEEPLLLRRPEPKNKLGCC